MSSSATSSSSPNTGEQQKIPHLPPALINKIQKGTAVVATLHMIKATYSSHFARNPCFPCDVIVTNAGHALNDDIVVIELDAVSQWQPKPDKNAAVPESKKEDIKNLSVDVITPSASPATVSNSAAAASASAASAVNFDNENENVDDDDQQYGTISAPQAQGYEGGPRHEDGRCIIDVLKSRGNANGEATTRRMELPELLHTRIVANGDGTTAASSSSSLLGTKLQEEWIGTNLQPRGVVTFVARRKKMTERLQSCIFFVQDGKTPPKKINKDYWYRFKPYNQCYPFIAVYGRDIPSEFHADINKYLYMVQINDLAEGYYDDEKDSDWGDKYPAGKVVKSLGFTGTVEAESVAITALTKTRDEDFSDEVNECVADECPIPSKEELKKMGRRDLRDEEFVTTIDPATARDLDDALSICAIPGGYRVGVHIADVSHFVEKDTALDFEASQRCTSTYLVERVIPMLPRKLCEDYCSLNAGTDKFAFSGIWTFNEKGEKQSEWFGQSVIRNRCRMAYGDAQQIIEGDESGESLVFVNEKAPRHELVKKVVDATKMLYKLSLILREKRLERGAISLGKKKLGFVFQDMNSRLSPIGFRFDVQREANRLVEEFMLWANFRVAEKVVEFLPRVAMLRQHSRPQARKFAKFVEQAQRHGYSKFTGSAKTGLKLREALETYKNDPNYDVLNFLVVITQSLAKYCCSSQGMTDETYEKGEQGISADATEKLRKETARQSGGGKPHRPSAEETTGADGEKKFVRKDHNTQGGSLFGAKQQELLPLSHFALAAPFYCHFTSPIRRYADLITHRQLLLALDIEAEIKRSNLKAGELIDVTRLKHAHYMYEEDEIFEIAVRCNDKKELAKKAGGMSVNLFLSLFLDALSAREKSEDAESKCATSLEEVAASAASASASSEHKKDSMIPAPRSSSSALTRGRFFCSGIVVRLAGDKFTVHMRELSLECEIFHNAKAQLWEGENEVDEDSSDFTINWKNGEKEEGCSIFTEFIGEVVSISTPITQTYFVILPPNQRKDKPMLSKDLRL